jgi:hypothetical protein
MIYDFQCPKCNKRDERYVRLANYDREIANQHCDCGARMKKVFAFNGTLAGLDKGGFLTGRVENDGCADAGMRARLRRNAKRMGENISGGFFVPGLCRHGVAEDPYAVCRSKSEVIEKARKLGRCLQGPGMDLETPIREEHLAKAERPYRASVDTVLPNVIDKIRGEHGGSVTKRKFHDMVESAVETASGNG